MFVIDENYKPVETIETDSTMYWAWILDKRDFFLRPIDVWQRIVSEAYQLQIGKHTVWIPSNWYLLIGDFDSGLDTIKIDEICYRDFDAFVMHTKFLSGSGVLEPIKILNYDHEKEFIVPFTDTPLPIAISKEKAIIVSNKDLYFKINDMTPHDII